MPTAAGIERVGLAAEVDVAHVRAHRGELLQHRVDRRRVAGGEQLGEVLDRDPQRVDRGEQVAAVLGVVPVSVTTSTTGDSGGMYQTIGIVRYSGCSGSATSYLLISAQTGERCAASTQSRGMPASRPPRITAGSCGSRNTVALRLVEVVSSGVDAASSTRSAS